MNPPQKNNSLIQLPQDIIDIDAPLAQQKQQAQPKPQIQDKNAPIPLTGDIKNVRSVSELDMLSDPTVPMQKKAALIQSLLDDIMPKIEALHKASQDLKMLVAKTQKDVQKATMVKQKPKPVVQAKTLAPKPKKASSSAKSHIQNFRIGDHIDYVRLVMDFRPHDAVDVIKSYNKERGVLTLRFNGTKWAFSKRSGNYKFVPFIESYNAVTTNDTTTVSIRLSPNAKIREAFALDSKSQRPRYVIDLTHK